MKNKKQKNEVKKAEKIISSKTKKEIKFTIYKGKVVACVVIGQTISPISCFPHYKVGLFPNFKEDGTVFCEKTIEISCLDIFNSVEDAKFRLISTQIESLNNRVDTIYERNKENIINLRLLYALCILNIIGFILSLVKIIK